MPDPEPTSEEIISQYEAATNSGPVMKTRSSTYEHSTNDDGDDLAWITDALAEIESIMRERHDKYGPGNIAQFGDFGVMVRLSDKLSRLQHSSGKDYADEATRDAWLDVIGYGLIGLAWVDGNWPGSEKS